MLNCFVSQNSIEVSVHDIAYKDLGEKASYHVAELPLFKQESIMSVLGPDFFISGINSVCSKSRYNLLRLVWRIEPIRGYGNYQKLCSNPGKAFYEGAVL
ncbi:hypothetical protein SDC9_208487 [bioreactor metagenome]|uniref:Uncharacterized protein n=1 Tax=bioreactor metagenome TaxID=1076179 RepID=A0A645JAQ2_9ZZZZ